MNITGDNMPEGRNKVLAKASRPTRNAVRQAFATGLAAAQGYKTDQDAADALGWSIGSVRNVRNRTNTLTAELLSDAMFNNGAAFIAPFLALHNLRAVSISSAETDDGDKLVKLAHALTALAEIAADGLDDHELVAKLDHFIAGKEVLFELCGRGERAKLRSVA